MKSTGNSALQQLLNLNGLDNVKKAIVRQVEIIRNMRSQGEVTQLNLNAVFQGNPGTGKTMVANLLSEIYFDEGVLSKGHMIEASRNGLIAGYVGQTVPKTKALCEKAKGGILFIDEAYSLINGDNDFFGKEALDTIIAEMENQKGDFCVIFSGYPSDMEKFIESNPVLYSRINQTLIFEDYTKEELLKIYNFNNG